MSERKAGETGCLWEGRYGLDILNGRGCGDYLFFARSKKGERAVGRCRAVCSLFFDAV